jgi:KipI family sensor histidine kinase inhibitor
MQYLKARALADSAITFDFARAVGAEASALVHAAQLCMKQAMAEGNLPGATEVMQAFCSVTLHYDCLATTQATLIAQVEALLADVIVSARPDGRVWDLPCCCAGEFAPDMDSLAQRLAVDPAEIVAQHSQTALVVYALGFLPGLPFMGDLPRSLALPRRTEPRTQVPAGSVAIANGLCVIYPWVSPGGWHILGNCPIPLFDVEREAPALLAAGDTVRFRPIDADEHRDLAEQVRLGSLDPLMFMKAVQP